MYVKITNGEVDTFPYSIGQLRRDNPNTSFSKQISEETLTSFGMHPVTISDVPTFDDRTQWVQQNSTPVLVDGVWTVNWTVTDKTTEAIQQYDELAASSNRKKRDGLLQETDWWGASDNTMTQTQTDYRQALRDITSHANWPNLDDDDWPTKP